VLDFVSFLLQVSCVYKVQILND